MGLFTRRKTDAKSKDQRRDLITDRAEIARLLDRMQRQRSTLSITAETLAEPFSSLLLHVSPTKGRVALDQLHPSDGDRRMKIGMPLLAASRLDGVDARFGVIIERIFQHEGSRIYQAEMPELLHYLQRRTAFRAMVPPEVPLAPSRLKDTTGAQLRAHLVDLSSNGIGAMVSGEIPVGVGEYLACDLNLPGARMVADVQVRATSKVLGNRRIGALFTDLNDRQRAYLDKVVAHFQRMSLRRRAGHSG